MGPKVPCEGRVALSRTRTKSSSTTCRVTAARRSSGGAPAQLPMIKEQEERRPPAFELHASRLLGHRLEHEVREGGAAFGCLAKLATRRGSPLRPVAPQEDLQSSLSSLPQRILVPAERCKPPYSREWLLAHRARCGGSPLRPTALHPSSSPSRHRWRRLRWMPPLPQGWWRPRTPNRRAMRRARLQQRARLVMRRSPCPRMTPLPTRSMRYSPAWRRPRQPLPESTGPDAATTELRSAAYPCLCKPRRLGK